MSTQSIIDALARLSPDMDKAALMSAVDTSVTGIVEQLNNTEDGKVPNDLLRATHVTLQFLEIAQDLKDAEFTGRVKERAVELLHAFGRVQGAGAGHAEAGVAKPKKKANAAATKKKGARAGKKAPQKNLGYEPSPFTEAFIKHLQKFLRERAMLWHVPNHGLTPVPFILSTKFADNLEKFIELMAPKFFVNRRITVMGTDLEREGFAEEAFHAVFRKHKKDNIVRTIWEDTLRDMDERLRGEAESDKKITTKERVEKKKKPGLFGLLGGSKKEKVVKRRVQVHDLAEDKAEAMWLTIAGPDLGYDPPKLKDIPFLRLLFDYNPEDVKESQESVRQLLNHEFGSAQAREGQGRDKLNELVHSQPEPAGELTALWAFLSIPKEFDHDIFRSFTSSHGTTPAQRKAALPYFLRWIPDYAEQDNPL